jgi:hypothetical protein
VVLFDAHYVYKFFSDSNSEAEQQHASAEVGVVHLMSSERGLKGGLNSGELSCDLNVDVWLLMCVDHWEM